MRERSSDVDHLLPRSHPRDREDEEEGAREGVGNLRCPELDIGLKANLLHEVDREVEVHENRHGDPDDPDCECGTHKSTKDTEAFAHMTILRVASILRQAIFWPAKNYSLK